MTPDLTKNFETDLEISRTNESSEDTVATPSSSKHAQRRLIYERNQKKPSIDVVMNKRNPKQKVKPPMQCDSINLSNHLEGHIHLSNKKALYYNMKMYYESLGENPFDYLPLTFHIKDGVDSDVFRSFTEQFKAFEAMNEEESKA